MVNDMLMVGVSWFNEVPAIRVPFEGYSDVCFFVVPD